MVKICEVGDIEGPPVAIAKQEDDRSYKGDSGLETSETSGVTTEAGDTAGSDATTNDSSGIL